ncbi:hypothetical protein B0H13DRAFT_2570980 [Mycena leptocephala]|nr:hypothetical protein B0H13DRAFT_2570980 [Mycena leptocephala]
MPRIAPSKTSLVAARKRKKELAALKAQADPLPASSPGPALSPAHSESRPLEFPPSPTPMAPPSDDEFPPSIVIPTRRTRSAKRKSDVASDTSDVDGTPPPKKKPVRAKTATKVSDVEDSEEESPPKPARKKPGPIPRTKVAAKQPAKRAAKPAISQIDSDDDVHGCTDGLVAH